MKIIHVPFGYFPDAIGGTELYVHWLVKELQSQNLDCLVAAPGKTNGSYVFEDVTVRRFAVSEHGANLSDYYGEGDAVAADNFAAILNEVQPDIVHLHAFTRGVSIRLLSEAKTRGIGTIFTYHTPTVSCQRGTLLRWGAEICDGKLTMRRCASCSLQGHGVNELLAIIGGAIPATFGELLGSFRLEGGAWTALRMTSLVRNRHEAVLSLLNDVDHIVVLSEWTRELLLRNQVPATKMTLSRHGLPEPLQSHISDPPVSPFKIAFMGRADRAKGIETLISAVRSLKDDLALDLYLLNDGPQDDYLQKLKGSAAGDSRIVFKDCVSHHKVISTLGAYHVVAIPSRIMETGPLIVLQAFAAGVPVMGADLGGIAELVQDGQNGILVPFDSVEHWKRAISSCIHDPELLSRLRNGISRPRSVHQVGEEMIALYAGISVPIHPQATRLHASC